MKLPITFEQFKSDPSKAIMFLLLGVVSIMYYRAEAQAKEINERCEARLKQCEAKLEKMSAQLKTQILNRIRANRFNHGTINEAHINRRAC
jgi:hypothetical protein